MAFVHSPKIVTDGLVLALDAGNVKSYASGSTTWLDKSGRGNNGTLTNGPTFNSGNAGSIVFDGANDFVNITDNNSIDFGTSNFTSNIWIYPYSSSLAINKEYGVINKNNGFQNSPGWGLELSTYGYFPPFPTILLEGFNSGQSSWGNTNVTGFIKTQAWSNINLVRNGNNFDMYINGILSNTTTNSNVGFNVDNSVNLTLAKNSTWQLSYKGEISNFNLYNKAFTAQEVLQNYNATKGRFGL
jgi:hypothetical protein